MCMTSPGLFCCCRFTALRTWFCSGGTQTTTTYWTVYRLYSSTWCVICGRRSRCHRQIPPNINFCPNCTVLSLIRFPFCCCCGHSIEQMNRAWSTNATQYQWTADFELDWVTQSNLSAHLIIFFFYCMPIAHAIPDSALRRKHEIIFENLMITLYIAHNVWLWFILVRILDNRID